MPVLTEDTVRKIVREEIAGTQSDVTSIKTDISGMKSDMTGMKSDIRNLGFGFEVMQGKLDTVIEMVKSTV